MAVETFSDSDSSCNSPPAVPHAAALFQRHGHVNVRDLIELTIQSIKFAGGTTVKRSGHIDLLVSDLDLHIVFPSLSTYWGDCVSLFEHSVEVLPRRL